MALPGADARQSHALESLDAGATLIRKTRALPFFRYGRPQDMLFAVREGVPVTDALECASFLLAAAHDIGAEVAQSEEGGRVWGVCHLIAMAKATVGAAVAAQSEGATI